MTHHGSSSVGIDTIYKSAGKIPEIFLRGAGIPGNFNTYVGALVGKPIEFYSRFISYSKKIRSSQTGYSRTCKRRVCGAGLRHTICKRKEGA